MLSVFSFHGGCYFRAHSAVRPMLGASAKSKEQKGVFFNFLTLESILPNVLQSNITLFIASANIAVSRFQYFARTFIRHKIENIKL